MEREKYDDSIRRDSIGLARGAMNEAASQMTAKPVSVMPAERVTSTGRTIETPTTDAAKPTVEPK